METRPPLSVIETTASAGESQRPRDKRPRSAVTSGRRLFVTGNPNSAWARRWADLVRGHIADAGGRDLVSEAHLALISALPGSNVSSNRSKAGCPSATRSILIAMAEPLRTFAEFWR
jgi:hypothetical protein